MSWGTEFKIDIYLSRQDYNGNAFQVRDKIEELDKDINDIYNKIKMYASATPKDIVDQENDAISFINQNIDELTESLEEYIINRYQLGLYLDYLESGKNS